MKNHVWAFGFALFVAGLLIDVRVLAATTPPTPDVPVYSLCNDPSIPWYLKPDCWWR